MSGRRTEQPTPRRLRRARGQGEIAASRELTSAAALLGGLAAVAASGPSAGRALADALRSSIGRALEGDAPPWPTLVDALVVLGRTAVMPCAAAVLGAVAAGSAQARGLFTLAAVRFRLDRLSPARGLARLVSGSRLLSIALGLVKAVVVLAVGWRMATGSAGAFAQSTRLGATGLLQLIARFALRTALVLGAVLAVFGVIDLGLAVRRHRRALMMTRDEVRREQREEQGDPRHRSERQRLHRALAAAGPLRRAACVVVNPTHLAVALQHDRGSDDAPIVIAKGAGPAAAQLRKEAQRAGVPVVRDVALARALFQLAEIGDEIPIELYDAAAAVLAHLYGSPEIG